MCLKENVSGADRTPRVQTVIRTIHLPWDQLAGVRLRVALSQISLCRSWKQTGKNFGYQWTWIGGKHIVNLCNITFTSHTLRSEVRRAPLQASFPLYREKSRQKCQFLRTLGSIDQSAPQPKQIFTFWGEKSRSFSPLGGISRSSCLLPLLSPTLLPLLFPTHSPNPEQFFSGVLSKVVRGAAWNHRGRTRADRLRGK